VLTNTTNVGNYIIIIVPFSKTIKDNGVYYVSVYGEVTVRLDVLVFDGENGRQ